MVALALVLVPGIGTEIDGARRWFEFGGITTIQPSEFAKIATILALASFVASRGPAMREFGNLAVSAFIVLLPMALVFRQPDLGTSLVYGVIWISVMTLAPDLRRYWIALLASVPALVVIAWEFLLAGLPEAPVDHLPQSGGGRAWRWLQPHSGPHQHRLGRLAWIRHRGRHPESDWACSRSANPTSSSPTPAACSASSACWRCCSRSPFSSGAVCMFRRSRGTAWAGASNRHHRRPVLPGVRQHRDEHRPDARHRHHAAASSAQDFRRSGRS